ncbi:MAG: hypothetical protein R2742_02695 [Micropruina glycogenica]
MPDEVDRIIAAWQLEAPGLDTEPLAVLSRVSRLARHLDLARKQCFAAHGPEVWEFDVLAALRREGPRTSCRRGVDSPDAVVERHHDQPNRPADGARAG